MRGAEQEARDSLAILTDPALVYGFGWLVRRPLLGVLLDRGDTAEAMEHARAMLAPNQQQLQPDPSQALELCVDSWDADRAASADEALRGAHPLAQTLGWD